MPCLVVAILVGHLMVTEVAERLVVETYLVGVVASPMAMEARAPYSGSSAAIFFSNLCCFLGKPCRPEAVNLAVWERKERVLRTMPKSRTSYRSGGSK